VIRPTIKQTLDKELAEGLIHQYNGMV
jgi:hypothetical protein